MKSHLLNVVALFSAVLLSVAATANAGSMTYNLTPYSFPDLNNPSYTDSVSGTITITNTAGSVFTTYTATGTAPDPALANVNLASTLTMSTNAPGVASVTIPAIFATAGLGTDTPPEVNWLQLGSLTASPSGLFLSHDGYLNINYENGLSPAGYISGEIDPHDDNGAISLFANPGGGVNGGAETMQIFPQGLDAVYGNGAWQIASAVPEPSTMILAALGGLALLACLRRRL